MYIQLCVCVCVCIREADINSVTLSRMSYGLNIKFTPSPEYENTWVQTTVSTMSYAVWISH